MKIYAVMQTEEYEEDYIHSYSLKKSISSGVAKKLNKEVDGYCKFFVHEIDVIELALWHWMILFIDYIELLSNPKWKT